MNIFKRVCLAIKYGSELGEIILDKIKEKKRAEILNDREKVNLCSKHQPKIPGAMHDPTNCDYCKITSRYIKKCTELADMQRHLSKASPL